jgi:hypothetical protein
MAFASAVDVKREVAQILTEAKQCLREVSSTGNQEKVMPLDAKIKHLLAEDIMHKSQMGHLTEQLKSLEENLILLGSVPSREHVYFVQESIVAVDAAADDLK